jgi:hypothetical protein
LCLCAAQNVFESLLECGCTRTAGIDDQCAINDLECVTVFSCRLELCGAKQQPLYLNFFWILGSGAESMSCLRLKAQQPRSWERPAAIHLLVVRAYNLVRLTVMLEPASDA